MKIKYWLYEFFNGDWILRRKEIWLNGGNRYWYAGRSRHYRLYLEFLVPFKQKRVTVALYPGRGWWVYAYRLPVLPVEERA